VLPDSSLDDAVVIGGIGEQAAQLNGMLCDKPATVVLSEMLLGSLQSTWVVMLHWSSR
jgi:hypothetical protein